MWREDTEIYTCQKYIMQKELFDLDKRILSVDSYYLSNQYNNCTVSKTKELEIY